ncbi:copper resistance CopC family protein [Blastococcus sp. SYSU D00813]
MSARLLVVLLTVATALLVAPAPASAHTELESTDPAADSTVTAAPAAVTLTFAGTVLGADVTVTGPDGPASTGPATVEGAVVRVPVSLTAAGRYEVTWYVTGSDGHPLQGTFGFEHAPPAAPEPTAAPTTAPSTAASPAPETSPTVDPTADDVIERASEDDDTGTAGWVLPVLAAAAVAVGAALVLLLRRRRG